MAEQVVFRRAENEDTNEIWDDTSLVRAYDDAINAVKSQMSDDYNKDYSKEPGSDQTGEKKSSKKKKKNRRKHQAKAADTPQKLGRWSVGDSCRAVYTEDGKVYEAVVRSVNPVLQTCVLRYRGYGNEEEQRVEELLPSALLNNPHQGTEDLRSEPGDVGMDYQPRFSPRGYPSRPAYPFEQGYPAEQGYPCGQGYPAEQGYPGYEQPYAAGYPGRQPASVGRGGSVPQAKLSAQYCEHQGNDEASRSRPKKHTDLPPPPIPPVAGVGGGEEEGGDSEALYSMLMAWYMSGFHTGFYQGKKAGKQEAEKQQAEKATAAAAAATATATAMS